MYINSGLPRRETALTIIVESKKPNILCSFSLPTEIINAFALFLLQASDFILAIFIRQGLF
jgi:hypothetical protein